MKKLNLNQMENIEGGGSGYSCSAFAFGLVRYGFAAAAILTATGPIGWLAIAGLAMTAVATGAAGANCAIDLGEGN